MLVCWSIIDLFWLHSLMQSIWHIWIDESLEEYDIWYKHLKILHQYDDTDMAAKSKTEKTRIFFKGAKANIGMSTCVEWQEYVIWMMLLSVTDHQSLGSRRTGDYSAQDPCTTPVCGDQTRTGLVCHWYGSHWLCTGQWAVQYSSCLLALGVVAILILIILWLLGSSGVLPYHQAFKLSLIGRWTLELVHNDPNCCAHESETSTQQDHSDVDTEELKSLSSFLSTRSHTHTHTQTHRREGWEERERERNRVEKRESEMRKTGIQFQEQSMQWLSSTENSFLCPN